MKNYTNVKILYDYYAIKYFGKFVRLNFPNFNYDNFESKSIRKFV